LPIGLDQTISQPYIVALMTELARPRSGIKVLEIGTGSGYQAAVLAEIVGKVYTIEILPELGSRARETLRGLGYRNVDVHVGDGFKGLPDAAPFDAIVVTAAPETIPPPLLERSPSEAGWSFLWDPRTKSCSSSRRPRADCVGSRSSRFTSCP
jgi:protein-L-isoaspartate(D-aspartate) O-methyltransferase